MTGYDPFASRFTAATPIFEFPSFIFLLMTIIKLKALKVKRCAFGGLILINNSIVKKTTKTPLNGRNTYLTDGWTDGSTRPIYNVWCYYVRAFPFFSFLAQSVFWCFV